VSGRAADVRHCRMSSSHPVKLTLSPQGSACAGIEPGTAGHAFFALTYSMNMHGRAAAMVTPIGDKKTLLPAESAVSSSGCAGRGRVEEGSSRKNKWKHARLQGAQRREGVCVGLGCRGPECVFACFPNGNPRDLGANGDGAPPQAHIHLNLGGYHSGSPRTKFGRFVTVCNRHLTLGGLFPPYCSALWGTPSFPAEPLL
jgi:hypothetical protein